MREIKFRAWDKTLKVFNDAGYELDCDGRMIVQDDCVLMQYTGLKDKHGREIYEGDIVSTANGDLSVKFYDGGFMADRDGHFDRLQAHLTKTWEVIGNIYENPELLKEDHA